MADNYTTQSSRWNIKHTWFDPHLHRHDEKKKQDTIYLANALSSWATGEISMWSAWEDSNLQPSDVNIADSVFKIIKNNKTHEFVGIEPTRFRF